LATNEFKEGVSREAAEEIAELGGPDTTAKGEADGMGVLLEEA